MIPLKLTELATLLDGAQPAKEIDISGIVTDSRKAGRGSLFAALPGTRVDGHDYADTAIKLGAVALLVSRPLDVTVPQLVVDDVLQALGRIGTLIRDRVDPAVVGITGSNGKTTVKEMTASILKQEGEVLATGGNYNNELGLPLTLFGLEEQHRYAVLEMGASRKGDIAYLAGLAKPDIGLVNNIAPAHLEGFGSIEGVARTKGEMFASLPADGWAVMNADEPWLDTWQDMNSAGNTITFGTAADSDVRLVELGSSGCIVTPQGAFVVELALPGRLRLI